MFLHSGAGMHRHEWSPPQSQNAAPRRIPLTRSAFSTPIPRKIATYENPIPIIPRPPRPLSEQIPRHEPTVRFQEPEADTMSEDGRSVANSEGSEVTTGGRRRRRPIRTSTTFHLAHPAPTLTQKQRLLEIRPRLLLQLQLLSTDHRPKPALDVVPSTVVVPRLRKKFPRMFRGKGDLGCNDVMVVKSEDYDNIENRTSDDSDSDEEGFANRDLLAVICQMRKDLGGSIGKAEIVLSDGSVWTASPLPNGLYEFTTIDDRGDMTTARWVRRNTKRRSIDASEISPINNDLKFTFSIIDPNSRRHPIMATITQNKLDIPDFYTSVSSSAGRYPPTSPIRSLAGESDRYSGDDEPAPERTTHAIDESMKTLIQVTGIWLALREGWSPYFKYDDSKSSAPTSANTQTAPSGRVRSLSLTPDPARPSPAAACASSPESTPSTLGAVFGGKIRRVSVKGCPSNANSPQTEQAPVPKRSVSAGTAFMQRATARRAGNTPSTVASDDEGENIMGPQRRTTTDNFHNNLTNRMSTPPRLFIPDGLAVTTSDTPTRSQRRVQSAHILPSALQNLYTYGQPERHSMVVPNGSAPFDTVEKPKLSRWKAFSNLFRRIKSE